MKTQTKATHTPTAILVDCLESYQGFNDYDKEFIIRAVNSHEELLSLLKCLVAIDDDTTEETMDNLIDATREAIAKAEGRAEGL